MFARNEQVASLLLLFNQAILSFQIFIINLLIEKRETQLIYVNFEVNKKWCKTLEAAARSQHRNGNDGTS